MQLTKEFAQTLKAGDRLEYTDIYGDKHTVTLCRVGLGDLSLYSGAEYCVRNQNGAFSSHVAKLHHLERAKPKKVRVVPGDMLNGLDETKIVPVGTIGRMGDYPPTDERPVVYWNGSTWVVVDKPNPERWSWVNLGEVFRPQKYRVEVISVPEKG